MTRVFRPLPSAPLLPQRRVAVTGLGCVSPLGSGTQLNWNALLASKSGLRRLGDEYASFPTRVAGCVPRGTSPGEFNLESAVGRAGVRSQGVDFIGFALQASAEALLDAGLNSQGSSEMVGPYSRDAFGVSIGSGIGCIDDVAAVAQTLALHGVEAGQRKVSPFFVPRILVNMASGNVSIRHGLRGPNHAASTACATGAHAIGDAFRMIKFGDADAMVAGGTEASIGAVALAGFSRAKAMATKFNDTPSAASRPFDVSRDGYVCNCIGSRAWFTQPPC
jgi:3-oxoacyl-[acyl-carrier-protein] synthase II